MSASVKALADLLDDLQRRVSALEGKPSGIAAATVQPAAAGSALNKPAAAEDEEAAAHVQAFDELVKKYAGAIKDASTKIGGDVAQVVSCLCVSKLYPYD
jgi:hypothetical protein